MLQWNLHLRVPGRKPLPRGLRQLPARLGTTGSSRGAERLRNSLDASNTGVLSRDHTGAPLLLLMDTPLANQLEYVWFSSGQTYYELLVGFDRKLQTLQNRPRPSFHRSSDPQSSVLLRVDL